MQELKIADRVLGFELEMGGQDLAGGVILEGNEGELGPAVLQPGVTVASGSAIMPIRGRGKRRARYWRGRRL
jgi:hypothetical protein